MPTADLIVTLARVDELNNSALMFSHAKITKTAMGLRQTFFVDSFKKKFFTAKNHVLKYFEELTLIWITSELCFTMADHMSLQKNRGLRLQHFCCLKRNVLPRQCSDYRSINGLTLV